MLQVEVKYHKKRAAKWHSAWCVDTRYVLTGGSRVFKSTKEEAQRHLEKLAREHSSTSGDAWKWTLPLNGLA